MEKPTPNNSNTEFLRRMEILTRNLWKPVREIYLGCKSNVVPWQKCIIAALVIQFLFLFRLDYFAFEKIGLRFLYPRIPWLHACYYYLWVTSPLLLWGTYRALLASNLTRKLTVVFQSIGLKNTLGKVPNLIYDIPLDEATRKLRLSMSALSLPHFQKAKPSLESALHVFIDDIKEDRVKGAVEVIYSHSPMPETFTVREYHAFDPTEFTLGTTRSKIVRASLNDIPHLLVAGQTGGGKSTFLRHFITSLWISDKKAEFSLIDLKGGLEFQLFENVDRISVSGEIGSAVGRLQLLDETLKRRMRLLKENKCKDILQYQQLAKPNKEPLPRQIIVVDEAAELFLSNALATAAQVRMAKEILSKIARQGRSLGIHLVIATQRPDSRPGA